MNFFTVPLLTFGVLHCFFVIGRDRRKILHFNVTRNPNALWVVQQLREACAYKQPHRFLLSTATQSLAYLLYYHHDRTHLGLAKDTLAGRATEVLTKRESKIQS